MTELEVTRQSISLQVSSRMETIIENWAEGFPLGKTDIEFLIDNAARFQALVEYEYIHKANDSNLDYQSAIKDLKELRATRLIGGVYHYPLHYFYPSSYNVETVTPAQIRQAVEAGLGHVRVLQESFDEQRKDIKVEGEFSQLKTHYGWQVLLYADSSVEDITSIILDLIIKKVKSDVEQKKMTLERLLKSEHV